MAGFSSPFSLAGNTPGSTGAGSSAFNSFFGTATGMGNPLTEAQRPPNPYDPDKQLIPWIMTENNRKEEMYNDPQRLRELMGVYSEFRGKEAAEANKMALQRQLLAEIPKTIREVGSNIAAYSYNQPRLGILASIPGQMQQAYSSMPAINIPRRASFG
jgi:hypothetical protein